MKSSFFFSLLLLMSASLISCQHVIGYEFKHTDSLVDPFSQVHAVLNTDENEILVQAELTPEVGSEFRVDPEFPEVRYADGKIEKIPMVVYSRQERPQVQEKFQHHDSYRIAPTQTEDVWQVQKIEKTFHGLITEASNSVYDERPKLDKLEAGKRYEFADPEDTYARRAIVLEVKVPHREMAFAIEGFRVTLDSVPYPPKTLHYAWMDRWEKWKAFWQ